MFKADYYLRRPEWVPVEVYRRELMRLEAEKIEHAQSGQETWKAMEAFKHEYLKDLHVILGEHNFDRYRAIRGERKEAHKKLLRECGFSEKDRDKWEKERKKIVEKYKNDIEVLKIEKKAFEELKKKAKRKIREIFLKLSIPEGEERVFPLGVEPPEGTGIYYPPFDKWGMLGKFGWSDESIEPERTWTHDNQTGRVACRSYIEVADADDYDYSYAYQRSLVGVWYKVPCDGRIYMKATFSSPKTSVRWGHTYNEFGISDCEVIQRAILITGYNRTVDSPNFGFLYPEIAQFGFFDQQKEWRVAYPPAGNELNQGYLFDSQEYKGNILLLWVGLLMENRFWADDYEITSGLDYDFTIKRIEIGIY